MLFHMPADVSIGLFGEGDRVDSQVVRSLRTFRSSQGSLQGRTALFQPVSENVARRSTLLLTHTHIHHSFTQPTKLKHSSRVLFWHYPTVTHDWRGRDGIEIDASLVGPDNDYDIHLQNPMPLDDKVAVLETGDRRSVSRKDDSFSHLQV